MRIGWLNYALVGLSLGLLPAPLNAASRRSCTDVDPTCKTVWIVHNSWHAAIVLKKADIAIAALPELTDFNEAQFIELSWGDQDYFPHPNAGVLSAVKAALWSSGSVLHLVGFPGSVANLYRGATITELRLTGDGFDRLLAYVSKTFARTDSASAAKPTPGLFSNSRFYPASLKFSMLRTCNTWVAEALEQAGLPIAPAFVISAGNLQSQLDKLKPGT